MNFDVRIWISISRDGNIEIKMKKIFQHECCFQTLTLSFSRLFLDNYQWALYLYIRAFPQIWLAYYSIISLDCIYCSNLNGKRLCMYISLDGSLNRRKALSLHSSLYEHLHLHLYAPNYIGVSFEHSQFWTEITLRTLYYQSVLERDPTFF